MSRAVPHAQAGATLIEILVTIIIVAFGLLGLAGLQMRMQMSENEAYQRSQALMLLNDMATRVATNRLNSTSYTGSSIDPSTACSTTFSGATQAQTDLKEWCNAIQGTSENITTGSTTSSVGGIINGRGCIASSGADVVVTVVWQGLTPISAPPSSVTCGANSYDGTGTTCVNDLCRRFVTTIVRIGTLT